MTDDLLDVSPGEEINKTAERLVSRARETGKKASAIFNDILVIAVPENTPGDVTAYYNAECDREAREWRESPAGIAAEKERQRNHMQKQREADECIKALPTLNFANMDAVIHWFCDLQDASDTIGVLIPKESIVHIFARKGYAANACCDDAFDAENREVFARYIIGQALDGLSGCVGAIHPMIHQFSQQWRDKFPS